MSGLAPDRRYKPLRHRHDSPAKNQSGLMGSCCSIVQHQMTALVVENASANERAPDSMCAPASTIPSCNSSGSIPLFMFPSFFFRRARAASTADCVKILLLANWVSAGLISTGLAAGAVENKSKIGSTRDFLDTGFKSVGLSYLELIRK